MKYRELGNTGINISEVSFGAWAIGGPFGFPGARNARQVQDNVGVTGSSLGNDTLERIEDMYASDVAQLVESQY